MSITGNTKAITSNYNRMNMLQVCIIEAFGLLLTAVTILFGHLIILSDTRGIMNEKYIRVHYLPNTENEPNSPNSPKPPISDDIDGISKHRLSPITPTLKHDNTQRFPVRVLLIGLYDF